MDSTLEAAIIGVGGAAVAALSAAAVAVAGFRKSSTDIREGQLAERFSRSVDQLGSDKIDVRIGGIYAPERISIDSPDNYHWTVMEVLAAFIRIRSHEQWPEPESKDAKAPEREMRRDVQTAIWVIGRRDASLDKWVFDLSNVILAHAILDGAILTGTLSEHVPPGPDGEKAWFGGADFTGASIKGANLADVRLSGAMLTDACLAETNLTNAKLGGAFVTGADFTDAVLTGADFTGASWQPTREVPDPPTGWVPDGSERLKRL